MSDKPDLNNVLQTYSNIAGLLNEAMFPGKWAPILHECQAFVAEIIAKIQKDVTPDGEPKATEPSTGSETSAGGVDGSPVPNP